MQPHSSPDSVQMFRQPRDGSLFDPAEMPAHDHLTTATEGPILIVDDDASVRSTLEEILDLEGYPFESAKDGYEALRAIEKTRPSLIVLDMRMAGLDGWSFAQKLRERGHRLPILLMTADQGARRWAEELGADGYLAKPFDLADLLDAIERLRDRAASCQAPPSTIIH